MLSFAAITPHPPIIVPEVGGKESKKCAKTIRAMEKLADRLAEIKPETLIIISPHALVFPDRLAIYASPKFGGDLGQFGAGEVSFHFAGDQFLAQKIIQQADEAGVAAFGFGDPQSDYGELDHGEMVPLYFLSKNLSQDTRILPIAFSYLNPSQHFVFGQVIREIAESNDFQHEKIALIASGDLSHRLIAGAPAGYSQTGQEFDQTIVKLLRENKVREILELDEDFIEQAGECGYRSILIALGALDGLKYQAEILSYEGPFGVGYLVANFRIKHDKNIIANL